MFRKYASAEIIAHSGQHTGRTAGKKTLGSFDYEPRDDHKYLYVAVRACTADVPNLNYDMLPSSELKGKEAYKTFIGSYVYLNHDNTDPLKARGAIIDAKYHDEDPDDQWVEILEELDEEKCPKLCSLIRSGEIDTVSMGCEVTSTTCSICGNEAEYPFEYCDHIKGKGQKYAGKLAYEICNGIDFFECSWVYNPADPTAYVQALDKTASKKRAFPDSRLNEVIYDMLPDFESHLSNGEKDSAASLSCASRAMDEYGLSNTQMETVRRGLISVYYGITRMAGKNRSASMKSEAVQTTFVPHWDMDYVTVEYTVYQCDDLENCDWVFFDYDFAMSHGFDFDKYRSIYHGHYDLRGPSSIPDWSDKQFLELLYTEWNTGKAPKDAWNMRSLSMSDIVYLYGHYYYCDRIGWREINPFSKTAADKDDNEEEKKKKEEENEEKEDSYANTPRKPDDIATKEEQTICPLCDSPSFDGEYCDICGYQVPPEGFDDIKLETDSDYEEYESEADFEDENDEAEDEDFDFGYEDSEDDDEFETEDEDIEETESEDEDEQFDFGYEEKDIDENDDEESDSDDDEEDKDKKKNAAALFDISDDPQTFIGMAEYGGDYQLIGFDIISTQDEWLQDELRMAGAKRID